MKVLIDKETKKNIVFCSVQFEFMGIGIMLDPVRPTASIEVIFTVEVNLIFLRFYWIRYK